MIDSCFERDWGYSKISKMVKNKKQLAQIKEFLRLRYKAIKDFYKTKSSFSGMHVFGIGANQLLEILTELGALDSKNLNAAAVGLEMVKCTTANPDDNRTMVNNNKCKLFIDLLTNQHCYVDSNFWNS